MKTTIKVSANNHFAISMLSLIITYNKFSQFLVSKYDFSVIAKMRTNLVDIVIIKTYINISLSF